MKHLAERQIGFDAERLGFPSTSACRAIVFQTANGLFGLHNYGNNSEAGQKAAAEDFASFVYGHGQRGAGVHLYAATRLSDGGSYARLLNNNGLQGKPVNEQFGAELLVFAKALKYKKGPISGVDLTSATGSSYVEFRASGRTSQILVKNWTRDHAADGVTIAPSVASADHVGNFQLHGVLPATVVSTVDTKDLEKVQPFVIRP